MAQPAAESSDPRHVDAASPATPDVSEGRSATAQPTCNTLPALLDALYRADSGRIRATLIRQLGDFDRAEEALHEAIGVALESWPSDGIPQNPVAWLISVGRFKGIDRLRKEARLGASLEALPSAATPAIAADVDAEWSEGVSDDHLRLIFTCCHPALAPDARAALTLREVCGLTTEEIASAFVATPAATAQRIVRAKNKIRDERLPYAVPTPSELPARLGSVLQVIYLVFNEGYSTAAGDALTRPDLTREAIRLGRVMLQLLPHPEVQGLLGLMLLQESRRQSRVAPNGDPILLEEQDRALWDRALIAEGLELVASSLRASRVGPYALQAAIAAVHAKAATPEATNWQEMVALYDSLLHAQPSPIVELNRAVAVAMRDGPEAGLTLLDVLRSNSKLGGYHLLYAARAELCRRLGRVEEAREAYLQALARTQQAPARRWLERRLGELA